MVGKILIRSMLSSRLCQIKYLTFSKLVGNIRRSNAMSSAMSIVFEGKTDRFDGVTVSSVEENCDIVTFPQKLIDSLEYWKRSNKRGIWFKISLEQADWVPILAKNGFQYHHALADYVMMYKWLPAFENCNIPPYAHTLIGVGAIVVNGLNKILVVKERSGITQFWKLPGGYVEPGENLVDAAMREVLEETNVQTEFESLVTVRHGHNAMFQCSDIYTVISLKPLTEDITKCNQEIEECEWMDLDEYLQHPHVHDLNRFFLQKYLEYKEEKVKIECTHGIHQILKKPYTVYHVLKTKD